jgi:selenocysteine lyase/cysteine desulfurase
MRVTRKELLAGAAAAGVVAGCGGSKKQAAAARFDPGDWASVKAQFALSRDVRHFDAFVLATHPTPVREAIERHRRGLDADPNGYLAEQEQALDARVADTGATYLQANATDLAFTDSTTMGLGLVYGGVVPDRPEVVATEHDFYATHEALRLRFGRYRRIRLYDDPAQATAGSLVEAVKRGVSGRTGLLALTWVHSSTGVKLPVARIAAALARERRHGLTMVVDGVHALGVVDEAATIDLCDVLVAGCHKWLGGPRGTGAVWSIKAWDRLRPTIPSFAPASYVAWLEGGTPPFDAPPGPAFTPGGYHSFEHRWALAEAFEFHTKIGRAQVAERISALATRLKEGLSEIPAVRLVTPMSPDVSAGIVCFDIDGMDAGEVAGRLRDEHRIGASVTPYAVRHVRLGTGLWVDEADVDAAVAAVRALGQTGR